MKRVILSDIHSSLQGLEAVLADAARRGISLIYNLGDTVGYGGSPRECIERVQSACTVNLRGNHDHAVLVAGFANRFSLMAQDAIAWTSKVLRADPSGQAIDFLANCDPSHREGRLLFCHASPRDHLEEYLFPDDIFDYIKLRENFSRIDSIAFVGHTHIPGVFVEFPNDYVFTPGGDFQGPTALDPARKAIVSVGSVGQPRDGNPDACYIIFDDDALTVEFVRVPYAIDDAADAILAAVPELDPRLADRLYTGS